MATTKKTKTLKQNLRTKFASIAQQKSRALAREACVRIIEEYGNVINAFYSEYTPTKYIRHTDRGFSDPGLLLTYDTILKRKTKTWYGGINILPDHMYTDYRGSSSSVLQSFLLGYHGSTFMGIKSSIKTWDHMIKFRDDLVSEFRTRCTP